MMIFLRIAVLVVCFSQVAVGEIIFSEILSNEPESRVLLEWLEVYNDNPFTVDLSDYVLVEGEDSLTFPEGLSIPVFSYVVLCRRLEPVDGSDCFEYHWGDSSDVWGDSPSEDYMALQMGITLGNNSGDICLLNGDGQLIDQYTWEQPSDDGRSVERDDVSDLLSLWHPCYDPDGSTPGRPNSPKPADQQEYLFDVSPQILSLSGPERFVNISYAAPTGTEISILVYDGSARKRSVLLENSQSPFGTIIWQGLDDGGKQLPPGLYLISFLVGGSIDSHKVIPVVISP
jgi:hypothetical protein